MTEQRNVKIPIDLKILVIDDMDQLRAELIKILRSLGFFNISEARDGEQALEKIESEASVNEQYQLILSNINMPKMTGIELLEKVRGHSSLKNTPFLLISTENERDIIIKALTLGVSNYIIKPFTHDIVVQKLNDTMLKFLS